jgi:hypothetical protein
MHGLLRYTCNIIWCVYGTTPVVTVDHLCTTTTLHYIFSMSRITSENWQQTIYEVYLNWSILYVKWELYWHIWMLKYSCVSLVNNCFCKIVFIIVDLAINHTGIHVSLFHLLLKSLSCMWLHGLNCTLAAFSHFQLFSPMWFWIFMCYVCCGLDKCSTYMSGPDSRIIAREIELYLC